MDRKIEIILVFLLYCFALIMWTLPVNDQPFGDVDSSTHFALGDYMASSDKPMYELPSYLDQQYGFANEGKIWYPPQYHVAEAIVSSFTGSRVKAVFLFNAFACSLIVLSLYLLIRKIYGFWPAFLASFLIISSSRDYLYYVMGLWPQTASFALIPLVVYLYHRYTKSYIDGDNKVIYMYMTAIILSLQFFFHAHPMLHSIAFIGLHTVFLSLKHRKIPFDLKHLAIFVVIILILCLPFFQFLLKEGNELGFKADRIPQLFSWYPKEDEHLGAYPRSFFYFNESHGGYWLLPLMIGGVLLLLMRRKESDLMMLAWLLSYYVMTHLDIIGLGARIPRSLGAEAQILYPIAVIGVLYIPMLLKMKKTYVKSAVILLFIVAASFFNMVPAYSNLKGAYAGVNRITPSQMDTLDWTNENIDEDKEVYFFGIINLAKNKWARALAHSPAQYNYKSPVPTLSMEDLGNADYAVIDYSDFLSIGRKDLAEGLLRWEQQILGQEDLVYSTQTARVYRIENR